MPLLKEVYKEKLVHKGYFNFSEIYDFCHQWLKNEGYAVSEEEYKEKLVGSAKEIEVKWVAGKKLNDYFKNEITVKWHILNMVDVEVEKEGKKEKMNKGELKIEFLAQLVSDYEKKWENRPFVKWLRAVYDNYIIRATKEEYESKLKDKTIAYVEDIKAYLALEGRR